jgi:hypothetical protein
VQLLLTPTPSRDQGTHYNRVSKTQSLRGVGPAAILLWACLDDPPNLVPID